MADVQQQPLPWTRIDAVCIDLGGVVYLPDHARMLAALARLGLAAEPEALDRAHYAGVAATDDFTSDHSVWHAYNLAYARVHGVPDEHLDDARAILLEEFERGDVWTREIDGVREALRALAALGIRLAVVSNADGTVERQLRDDGIGHVGPVGPGDGVEFAAVLDSRIVGVAKPDPAIFRRALDALGTDPEHTLHIGDTPAADVEGARAAGIHPVLVDPFDHHGDLDCVRVRHLDDLVTLLTTMPPLT
jgi:putative hydrolase of the HAD superfamily